MSLVKATTRVAAARGQGSKRECKPTCLQWYMAVWSRQSECIWQCICSKAVGSGTPNLQRLVLPCRIGHQGRMSNDDIVISHVSVWPCCTAGPAVCMDKSTPRSGMHAEDALPPARQCAAAAGGSQAAFEGATTQMVLDHGEQRVAARMRHPRDQEEHPRRRPRPSPALRCLRSAGRRTDYALVQQPAWHATASHQTCSSDMQASADDNSCAPSHAAATHCNGNIAAQLCARSVRCKTCLRRLDEKCWKRCPSGHFAVLACSMMHAETRTLVPSACDTKSGLNTGAQQHLLCLPALVKCEPDCEHTWAGSAEAWPRLRFAAVAAGSLLASLRSLISAFARFFAAASMLFGFRPCFSSSRLARAPCTAAFRSAASFSAMPKHRCINQLAAIMVGQQVCRQQKL